MTARYRIAVATPVDGDHLTGQVSAGYAIELAKLISPLVTFGANHVVYSKDVVRARNRLAAMVLRELPETTHVLWWDSDVAPTDTVGALTGMLATGQDVIGAPYLRKRSPPTWSHRPFEGYAHPTAEERYRTYQAVKSVGLGFTLTSVRALRALSSEAPAYVDKRSDGSKHTVAGIFDLAYLQDEAGDVVQESEDYSFCARWRHHGDVCLYLGPGSVMHHVGSYAFTPGAAREAR